MKTTLPLLTASLFLVLTGCEPYQPPTTNVTPDTQRFELVSAEVTNNGHFEIYKDRRTERNYLLVYDESHVSGLVLMPEER